MALLLIARYQRPGEYVILDGDTRELVFGPFQSNDNALLVEARVRRQLKGAHEVCFEWAAEVDWESDEPSSREG